MISLNFFGKKIGILDLSSKFSGGIQAEVSPGHFERNESLLPISPAEVVVSDAMEEGPAETTNVVILGWKNLADQWSRLFKPAVHSIVQNNRTLSSDQHSNSFSINSLSFNLQDKNLSLFQSTTKNLRILEGSVSNFKNQALAKEKVKMDDSDSSNELFGMNHYSNSVRQNSVFQTDDHAHLNHSNSFLRSENSFILSESNRKMLNSSWSKSEKKQHVVNISQSFGDIIIQPTTMDMSVENIKVRLQDALKQVRDSLYY
jgi:hypothetical protein